MCCCSRMVVSCPIQLICHDAIMPWMEHSAPPPLVSRNGSGSRMKWMEQGVQEMSRTSLSLLILAYTLFASALIG